MTGEHFWQMIAASRIGVGLSDNLEMERAEQVRLLLEILAGMSGTEVHAFTDHFAARIEEAYSRPQEGLWAVAADIGGGCSDDSFADFRAWLVSMGQAVYEAALRDPESVYSVADQANLGDEVFFEDFLYIPSLAVRALERNSR